ncbi:MAG: polyprenyl synthetase family protein [Holophagales bacterium]|nr:polyprenyl synthetase family protein [Holophagales bacterium]
MGNDHENQTSEVMGRGTSAGQGPSAEKSEGEGHDAETVRYIRRCLKSMDEVEAWPELIEMIDRPVRPHAKPSWEYVFHGCEAVGGERRAALPASASIFCLLYSIHLVDDLLDEDPDGLHHRIGVGRAANAALAFHGMAGRVVAESQLPAEKQALAQGTIARMGLATAYGQNLDVSDPEGEESYWQVLRHKTPPLFGCALVLGALYGGADRDTAESVGRLGQAIGEIVQINDDLKDAMDEPARPDWQRRWTNLPILYGLIAEHRERERFQELVERTHEAEALREAQEILVRSGAVSYCAYRIIEAFRGATETIRGLDLPNPRALDSLVERHVRPLESLLRSVGVESPEELFGS